MRCKRCGCIINHLATDIKGNNYYKCTNMMTTLFKAGDSPMTLCDLVYDQHGKDFTGHIQIRHGNGESVVIRI
jgi:hypothetical protein